MMHVDNGSCSDTSSCFSLLCTIDTSISATSSTLTANLSGATYQWIDCNNGNSPIPGVTGQSYTPSSDGTYAVIIDNGNCSDTSSC